MTTKEQTTTKPDKTADRNPDVELEQLNEASLSPAGILQQAREDPRGVNPAGAARLQRTIGNQATVRFLQRQPNRSQMARSSLNHLISRLADQAPAGVQRHPGHPPHMLGWSERRQHWSQAMTYLRDAGIARLTEAQDELSQANIHNPGEPTIMAQWNAVQKIIVNRNIANVYGVAGKTGHQEGQWHKAQKTALNTFPHSVTLLANIAAQITLPMPTYKARKYMERGDELKATGDHLHAAVQYERAYTKEPNNERALKIGEAFQVAGDSQRAAIWYRKVLDSGPTAKQNFAAVRGLHQMGMKATAMFDVTKPVDPHYTEVTKTNLKGRGVKDAEILASKRSGKYAEELHTNVVSNSVQKTLADLMSGKTPPAHLPTIQDFIANKFGVREATLQELVIEFARMHVQAKGLPVATVLADIQKLYPGTVDTDLTVGAWPTLVMLAQAKVTYLQTSDARKGYKLSKSGGLIKQGDPAGPPTGYDTANESTNASGQGYAIYVMSADGDIYAASHKVDRFHHSSFLAGAAAAGAGEIKVTAGRLVEISNKSGHYQPGPEHLVQSVTGFKQLDTMAGVILRYHTKFGKIVNWTGGPDDFVQSVAAKTLPARVSQEVALQGGWKP